MKKLQLALLLFIIALPALAITVQDFAGREVTLKQPATRIVAQAAPHINTPVAGDSSASAMCIATLRRGGIEGRGTASITNV